MVTIKSIIFWVVTPCSLVMSISASEKCITSTFRVKEQAKQETSSVCCLLLPWFTQFTLKTEAKHSYEKLVDVD
jgi:hypothetical protein